MKFTYLLLFLSFLSKILLFIIFKKKNKKNGLKFNKLNINPRKMNIKKILKFINKLFILP